MKKLAAILSVVSLGLFLSSTGMSQSFDASRGQTPLSGTPGGTIGTNPGGTNAGSVSGYPGDYGEILGAFVADPGKAYGGISAENIPKMESEYVTANSNIPGALGVNPGGTSMSRTK